jgi:hypothetical protein
MGIEAILAQIDTEIAKLTQVRNLLAGTGKITARLSGETTARVATRGRKKRILSPEARKRIADAQRRRWAAQKAKSKTK